MNALIRYLFALTLFVSATSCFSNTESWKLQSDKNNIKVYQKPSPSGYAITRGLVVIETNANSLLSFMRDRSTCKKWVYACKSGYIAKQYTPNNRLDYTVIDSPLWFSDRDFYIQSNTQYDTQSKTITIKLSGREKYDEGQQGRVRTKDLYGLWKLRQKNESYVSVLYQIHGNPQLPPSSFLDAYMVKSTFQTLKNLQSAAQNDYQ